MEGNDEALLTAWRDGDPAAGKELYRRYFPIVYRFFASRLAGAEIEDLVQTTFLACTRHLDRLRDNRSFRAFVLVVARNEFFGHLQKRYRSGNTVDPAKTSLADVGASASELLARRDEHRLLSQALRRIPLDLQDLVELHYFEQLTGPELAAVLEVPEGTIRSRLRRAIASLRAELERMARSPEEVESTMGSLSSWAAEIRELCGRGLDQAAALESGS